jgi:hypothetical protein
MHKVGIIVPYRNRKEQLKVFKEEIVKFLLTHLEAQYTIIVVDQVDKKKFNRGKLLNIGFLEAKKRNCDYVIFHDVDMIPVDGHYNYSDKPLQLANNFIKDGDFTRTIQRNYFGGVTLFPTEQFEAINGYSNKYKGWGFEDDDLLLRCREVGLKLEKEPYKSMPVNKPTLYFTGKDSYVQLHNIYRSIRPFTLISTFAPDSIYCDPSEITDEFTVFSIPGHDMNISFNSFSRYKFELFLKDNTPVSLTSDYTPPLPVQVVVNVNPRKKYINYYLNGKLVEEKYWGTDKVRLYEEEPFVYFGVAEPNRKVKQKFFKGYISNIGILHGELTKAEIKKLFLSDPNRPLTETNPELNNRWNGYWDSLSLDENGYTLKDLSGYKNDAWLKNCLIKDLKTPPVIRVEFPYRRKCTYKLMKHDEAGYTDGFWKDWSSRENQLRYYRLVNSGISNFKEDGLSTCTYRSKIVEETDEVNNYIRIEAIT